MMSAIKTVGVGLALVGTGYVAYKAVMKAAGMSGDATPLAEAVETVTVVTPGRGGYRDADGKYHKKRSYRSAKDKQDAADALAQTKQ